MNRIVTDEFSDFLSKVRGCKVCGERQYCVRHDNKGVYIHCHHCKYETKSYPTLGEALGEWNKTAEFHNGTDDYTVIEGKKIKLKAIEYASKVIVK